MLIIFTKPQLYYLFLRLFTLMLMMILRNAEKSVSLLFCPPFPFFLKILKSC